LALAADRDDTVSKALSGALRQLVIWDGAGVSWTPTTRCSPLGSCGRSATSWRPAASARQVDSVRPVVPGRVQNPARRGACLTYLTTMRVLVLPLDLPHVRSAETGNGVPGACQAAKSSCGGGRASSDGRWRFLRRFRRGLLAGGFFDRFCIHVQMVWNRPLTMATATALVPVMRATATMGSSNLMGTSTTPGQATTSRVPASHAPCLILLSLIGAFSGKPSGLFHRQTRCPGSRHRESTSRARPACLVHTRRAWLREQPGRPHRQRC
jgi:hypothetical protein